MIGIGGTLFSQEKIWDTEFAVRVSRDTLRRQGSPLSQASFLERWQAASVYPGFIYLYPALMQYLRGDDSRLEKLINLLLAG